MEQYTIQQLVTLANLPRTLVPVFELLRSEAFHKAVAVYEDRVEAYDVDHQAYEEMVYGPVSLASEVFKRSRRLAALLSPLRTDPLRPADLNRALDICIDTINYLSWTYALIKAATRFEGNADSDDAPNYLIEQEITNEPAK